MLRNFHPILFPSANELSGSVVQVLLVAIILDSYYVQRIVGETAGCGRPQRIVKALCLCINLPN